MNITKVPFDYEEFISNNVVVFFNSREEIEDFEANFYEHWEHSPYYASGRERPSKYWRSGGKLALRFQGGQWVNRGNHSTYRDGEWGSYTKMNYQIGVFKETNHIEVGDLL